MARVTLKTVAERVGVSPMTVSNAPLRLLRRVRRAVPAMIAEELGRGGLALTLLPDLGARDVLPVRDVAMDGAIVYSCSPTDENVAWLRRRRLPLVLVDQPPDEQFSSVDIDDRAGARAAAAHLLDLGHRRIALIAAGSERPTAPDDWYVPRERLRGWRDALEPAGVVPVLRYVEKSDADQSHAVARELFASPDRPTAVLAFSDALAMDVVRAADGLGLRVPADLSVVGFDDSPLAARGTPRLTTVRQDVVRKGTLAAVELVAAVRGRRAGVEPPVHHHVLAAELVVRGTTAPPVEVVHGTNGTFVGEVTPAATAAPGSGRRTRSRRGAAPRRADRPARRR